MFLCKKTGRYLCVIYHDDFESRVNYYFVMPDGKMEFIANDEEDNLYYSKIDTYNSFYLEYNLQLCRFHSLSEQNEQRQINFEQLVGTYNRGEKILVGTLIRIDPSEFSVDAERSKDNYIILFHNRTNRYLRVVRHEKLKHLVSYYLIMPDGERKLLADDTRSNIYYLKIEKIKLFDLTYGLKLI